MSSWVLDLDDPTALRGAQRVFTAQLLLCVVIGVSLLLLFCMLRAKWPHMYALRTLREGGGVVRPLPPGWFGWVPAVIMFLDEELLRVSGLDAYVFVAFFQMAIRIFLLLLVLAVCVILPARYWTHRDDGVKSWAGGLDMGFFLGPRPTLALALTGGKDPIGGIPTYDGPWFFWLYVAATYAFSAIVYLFLFDYTKKILKIRQKYLASQDSVTDRTILLSGIPKKILSKNNPRELASFVESMGIGKVLDVKLVYDWEPLDRLFVERKRILGRLEEEYAKIHGLSVNLYNDETPAVVPKRLCGLLHDDDSPRIVGLRDQLLLINRAIRSVQDKFDFQRGTMSDRHEFKQISSAFITMDSVALAQMAAQTVLDPRVHKLIVHLAPAPKDIKWDLFRLSPTERVVKLYIITFIIVLSFLVLFFPISSISTLLNLKTITKLWPDLGAAIGRSKTLTTLITGLLPPFLFLLFNFLLPYFYKFLTYYQGYLLNSDIELSTLLKNFFYIFFNLFLVFTVTGTASNFFGLIGDTTKIAYQLATSLQRLSLFYINLILLQGVAMFPIRLLQISDFLLLNILGKVFFLRNLVCKTPRDYRFYYYTPPIFDFGLQLPQHLLIFIIVLIYSVVLTKIITCGLVYFVLGHLVYKYQLIYNFVHPPHSTGKVWPMIFRRLILGVIIFQIFMCGTLALNDAYILAALCVPLIFISLIIQWNFENYYLPLHKFIALRAIQNPYDDYEKEFNEDESLISSTSTGLQPVQPHGGEGDDEDAAAVQDEGCNETTSLLQSRRKSPPLRRRKSTIDEEREQFSNYTYPHLNDPLNGPWVGFEGNYVSLLKYSQELSGGVHTHDYELGDISILSTTENETIIKKKLTVSEWE